jgi:hypothetical protein
MNNLELIIIPIGFIVAAIIGYLAVKHNWKIAEFF